MRPADPALRHGQILICLPDEQALVILNDVLTGAGFAVTSTSTLPEFEDACRLGGHCAVVTVAAMMGPIRAISDLPLLDIHPFSRRWNPLGLRPQPELFERETFLRRIRDVVRQLCRQPAGAV